MTPINSEGRTRFEFEPALDRCVCYPMETATVSVRVTLRSPNRTLLCVHLPKMTERVGLSMTGVDENNLRFYSQEYDGTVIAVPLDKYMEPGSTAVVDIKVQLNTLRMNHRLSFCVWMASEMPDKTYYGLFEAPKNSRSVELTVKAHAAYLNYLPELYSYDDFMNRFLMLFESFWKPINSQISQVENYFDPDLTPDSFVKWLSTWVGLDIDETFPMDRVRGLIRHAGEFYRSRGTAASLKMMLELYSGGTVSIVERKAKNMVLGKTTYLGDSLALGTNNKPNTVLVNMTVPASELERTGFTEEKYSKKIRDMIRGIVPAHTVFTLNCKFE